MDGPPVSWKFHKDLEADRVAESLPSLLDIGSCGLHVANNAFRAGHSSSEFAVHDFLKGSYYLFKRSPARKADFTRIAGVTKFPKKFCATRWVENSDLANRGIEIFDNVKNYVLQLKPEPQTAGFSALKRAIANPALLAQLHFFKFVVDKMEGFLRMYQSDSPLVPLLGDDLDRMIRCLMRCFVKEASLVGADSYTKLSTLNISDPGNVMLAKHVDCGLGAANAIRSLTDGQKLRFQCLSFFQAVVSKLLAKSPPG